jgi:hypothetical protein
VRVGRGGRWVAVFGGSRAIGPGHHFFLAKQLTRPAGPGFPPMAREHRSLQAADCALVAFLLPALGS